MKTFLAFVILLSWMITIVWGGEPRVYTDSDIEQYKNESDDSSYQYNQRVLEESRRASEHQQIQKPIQNIEPAIIEERAQQSAKKQKALQKIYDLEKEKAQDKIDAEKGEFIGGYVGKRNKEQKKERGIAREAEIDQAYREAGLSQERDLQKRAEEAEAKAKQAERRARSAESAASIAEIKAREAESGSRSYFDIETGRPIHCSGGICQ